MVSPKYGSYRGRHTRSAGPRNPIRHEPGPAPAPVGGAVLPALSVNRHDDLHVLPDRVGCMSACVNHNEAAKETERSEDNQSGGSTPDLLDNSVPDDPASPPQSWYIATMGG